MTVCWYELRDLVVTEKSEAPRKRRYKYTLEVHPKNKIEIKKAAGKLWIQCKKVESVSLNKKPILKDDGIKLIKLNWKK